MYVAKKNRAKRLWPEKVVHQSGQNYQLWRVIDGAVRDALINHPDYLSKKGERGSCARRSIVKRVVGGILSYLEQSKQGRSG